MRISDMSVLIDEFKENVFEPDTLIAMLSKSDNI